MSRLKGNAPIAFDDGCCHEATSTGANTSIPAREIRKVCSPGNVGWPRIFMISILRTMELRTTFWRSQISPSETVNTGLASASAKYSPIRKVVACQLVISMPSGGQCQIGVGVGPGEASADREGAGRPTGHGQAQLLHELLQGVARIVVAGAGQHDGAERIDEDQCRIERFDFLDNAFEHEIKIAAQGVLGQIDETDGLIDRVGVEEIELLLIPQHFQRRFAQHGEVQRATLWADQREHDLVGQRGLAAAGRTGDEIEGEFGKTPAQNLIQAGHTGRQSMDGYFACHAVGSSAGGSLNGRSHKELSNRSVSESPTRLLSNS